MSESFLNLVTKDSITEIKCSNCRRNLLLLYEKEKSGTPLYKIKVECPWCVSETSFIKEIFGVMRSVPAEGVQLLDKIEQNGITLFKTRKAKP